MHRPIGTFWTSKGYDKAGICFKVIGHESSDINIVEAFRNGVKESKAFKLQLCTIEDTNHRDYKFLRKFYQADYSVPNPF